VHNDRSSREDSRASAGTASVDASFMSWVRRALARLLCGTAMAVLSLPLQAGPLLGVYRWDGASGPSNVDGFGQWLGRPADIASAVASGTWENISGAAWQLGPWSQWVKAKQGRNLLLGVGLFPGGGSLASCAAGQYDYYYRKLANNLAYYGLHWAYLRLGWEMDGKWYPWSAPAGSGKEASFAACFRRVVQVMRQAQPANQWKFVFNPTIDTWRSTSYLETVWPGDSYVHVVAADMYDKSWLADTYPYPSTCDAACRLARQQKVWSTIYAPRLGALRNFAIAHGKPLGFAEWGVIIAADGHGGGDNPYFIDRMYEFIANPANNVAFHTYFGIASWTSRGFDTRVTASTAYDDPQGSTRMPSAAGRFKQRFGSSGPSIAFSAPVSGATISGSFSNSTGCQVTGTGIAKVVFFMDATQLNTESYSPWQCTLDTRKFANGTHTLRAVGYNSAGASTSVTLSVYVKN
jgi:hypothetical protein